MPKARRILLVCIFLIAAVAAPSFAQSQLIDVTVHSSGLEHNLLGDSADQPVTIYVPAEYRTDPERRFATIYFLQGFASGTAHTAAVLFAGAMDKLIAQHSAEPMIVVVPNGINKYLGAFYVNSKVTGNWEDYIFRDAVNYVDSHYRTIASADSRALVGHSMGGYGALMVGFKHPDIFAYIYALSPCCTVMEGDLGPSNPAWGRTNEVKSSTELPAILGRDFFVAAFIAMEAAFTPNPDKLLFGDSPFRMEGKQLVPDPAVYPTFQSKIPATAIPSLLPSIYRLKGIFIDYGAEDNFSHIIVGAQKVSQGLSAAGVPHTLAVYTGDHGDHAPERIETSVLPWLSKQMKH